MRESRTDERAEQNWADPRRSTPSRKAGLAAILGGALFAMPWEASQSMIVEGTFLLVGIALLQWGIAGFYAQYKDRYGRLGVVGTYLVGLGLLPFAVGGLSVILVAIVRGNPLSPTEPISMPLNEYVLITQAFMLGLFIASAGAFALGISLWRADIGVRGGAVLLASALPLLLFLPAEQLPIIKVNLDALLATGTFGLAWIILGDRLRTATPVRG